jgi:rhodanese-related sulfurtransferase
MFMKSLMGMIFGTTAMAIDFEVIKNEIKHNKAVIIDVREDFEVKEGILNSAKHIPLGKIPQEVSKIKELTQKGNKVYLYCRSGNRSGQAEAILKKQGIESLNIGGYEDLKVKGF